MDFIGKYFRRVPPTGLKASTPPQESTLSRNRIYIVVGLALVLQADIATAQAPVFDDSEIRIAVCQLMDLMNSSLGALLTAVAGIGAIVGAAFGAYKASMSMITVAVASYIMPTLVGLWFGGIQCQTNMPQELDSVAPVQTGPVYQPTGSEDCVDPTDPEDCGADLDTQECSDPTDPNSCNGDGPQGVPVEIPPLSDDELLATEDPCGEWQRLNPERNIFMEGPLPCRAPEFMDN